MKQILGICVVLAMALSSSAFAGDSRPGHGTNRALASEDLLAGDKLLSGAQDENRLAAARISRIIANHKKLVERFNIRPRRAAAIIIGPKGKENVIDDFLATEPGDARILCIGRKCACYGDDDCNKMFTTICADPSTNGSCTGQICTCTP